MNYVFPNEINVTWTVMIVLYPYITGLVAGAFIVSSLYHVFGRTELEPVARFSLASAFVFLLFAPLPLLIHLGQPLRAFNIMITPNFTSAMAGFGFIYTAYLILVALEIWFVMRSEFLRRARGQGIAAFFCRAVLLFNLHESDATRRTDHRIARFLAGLGIPMACLLHGYVGFLFGSLKANPWWSTPLMFVIFIFSAIVSGISVLIFHSFVVARINRWRVDQACVRSLARYLWGFMMVAVSLELLEVMSVAYKQTEEWEVLGLLIHEKLFIPYVVLQFGVFSLIPFLLLAIQALFRLRDRVANALDLDGRHHAAHPGAADALERGRGRSDGVQVHAWIHLVFPGRVGKRGDRDGGGHLHVPLSHPVGLPSHHPALPAQRDRQDAAMRALT